MEAAIKMTLKEITEKIPCTAHFEGPNFESCKIENIVAGDLMSEVLVAEEENLLLVTALNTEQALRTAHIVDACGVLLVNGKKPQAGMLRLAKEFDLTLISTGGTMFNTCGKLYRLRYGDNT